MSQLYMGNLLANVIYKRIHAAAAAAATGVAAFPPTFALNIDIVNHASGRAIAGFQGVAVQ